MQKANKKNEDTFRQQASGGDLRLTELESLRLQVRKLNELLIRERNERMLLREELEEAEQQVAKQRELKESFIKRGKDTKKELETLQKYSSEETLSRARIAAMVRDTTRQKKKKDLHVDYEALKVAYLVSDTKFTAELQVEREKNQSLQEEIEKLKVSNQDYENDRFAARRQLEPQLTQQLQQNTELAYEFQAAGENIRPPERNVETQEDQLCMERNLRSASSDTDPESVENPGDPEENHPERATKPAPWKQARLKKPKKGKK